MNGDKDYLSRPLREFLADLAAKSATPGGGSVSALLGSLSATLARMVVEYTVGKKKYADHEERLRELLNEFKLAGDMFNQLMSEDMAAYQRYAASRKSDDADERQRAVATAVAVPMEIVMLAGALAGRYDEIKTFINPHLLSDLQIAALLAYLSAQSACINARLNITELTDRKEAERLESQLDLLTGQMAKHRDAIVDYQFA